MTPASRATSASILPWAVGGLAVIVLLVILVAQRSGTASNSSQPSGVTAPMAPFAGGAGAVAAPDISTMSPRERASRLFNRIMQAASEGKQDSVMFFAPMASIVYESLGKLDADLRYDYGRISEVSGRLDVAAAQADSILMESPTHLLGLILAARVAERRGDERRRASFEQQLLSAEASELKRPLEEYSLHRGDIEAAVTAARSRRR